MSYADLLTPAQDAVIAALKPLETDATLPAGLRVFQAVPQDTQPPYARLGEIISMPEALPSGEQLELLTVEVVFVWRGDRRRELLAIMAAARGLLHDQAIGADGAIFAMPSLKKQEASEPIADGVTYVGLQTYEFYAQPA